MVRKTVKKEAPANKAKESRFNNPLAAYYAKGIQQVEKKTRIYNNTVTYASRLGTGILCYDWMCGGGLLPGFSIISGEEQSGKCVTGETLVNTNAGFLEMREFIEKDGYTPVKNMRITTRADAQTVSHIFRERSKTIRVKTKRGYYIEGTPEHRMLTLDSNLDFSWKRLDELSIKDWIISNSSKTEPMFGSDSRVSMNMATIMGYLTASGRGSALSTSDKAVAKKFAAAVLAETGNTPVKVTSRNKVPRYHIPGSNTAGSRYNYFDKYLVPLGYTGSSSRDKSIPLTIRQAPREILHEYLESYFECDCTVNGRCINVISASKRLVRQLQNILLTVYNISGKSSSRTRYASNSANPKLRRYYSLRITGEDAIRFLDAFQRTKAQWARSRFKKVRYELGKKIPHVRTATINAYTKAKLTKKPSDSRYKTIDGSILSNVALPKFIKNKRFQGTNHWANAHEFYEADWNVFLPILAQINPDLAAKLKVIQESGYSFENVVKITKSKKEKYVYDVTVPANESFVANGLISHNTTTVYHAQAQSIFDAMPLTIFWDAEGTLSPKYATNIWRTFDLDLQQMIKQPESGYRYYRENVIEKFFDFIVGQLNLMPIKEWNPHANSWSYRIPKRDKYFEGLRDALGLKIDKALTNDHFYVCLTDNDRPEGMVAVDSFAAMITDVMEEEEERGGQRAQEASAFSLHLKRVMAKIQSRQFIMLGTNQLRKVPGKVYGGPDDQCFTGNTTVVLADGSVRTIRDIVRKKLKLEVMSFNPKTGEISAKKITNWFDNKNALASKFLKLSYISYDSLGRKQIRDVTCTKNHKIWTKDGWEKAGNLTKKSKIFTYAEEDIFNEDQKALIVASLLGDGVFTHQGDSFFRINWSHSTFQRPYLLWKLSVFGITNALDTISGTKGRIGYVKSNGDGFGAAYKASSGGYFNREFGKLIDCVYSESLQRTSRQKSNCQELVDLLDLRSLAIWYLDDGYSGKLAGSGRKVRISCSRFSAKERKILADKIAEITGVERKCFRTKDNITIRGLEATTKFLNVIARFIPICMSYKLFDPSKAGEYIWTKEQPVRKMVMLPTKIVSINPADEKSKYIRRYDIEVEDNHTYFVGTPYYNRKQPIGLNSSQEAAAYKKEVRPLLSGGLAVSNSYEPGGEALRYFSQNRSRTYSRKVMDSFDRDPNNGKVCVEPSVEGKGQDKYMFKEFKNTKNKTGVPLLRTHARVWTSDRDGKGRGFDPVFDTYQHLVNTRQLQESKGKMKFALNDSLGKAAKVLNDAKPFEWDTLKRLVLSETTGRKDLLKEAVTRLDINVDPKLRSRLFAQMQKDQTLYQVHDEMKIKAPKKDLEEL